MAKIPSLVIDSGQVRAHERFAFWRHALGPTHALSLPEGHEPESFSGSGRGHHLGKAFLAQMRTSPLRRTRTPRAVRADQIDHYIVRVQDGGHWSGELGGRTVATGAGSVLDMARPSDGSGGEMADLSLVLPRDVLDDLLPPFPMHGLELRDGMATLLRSHLGALAAHLPHLDAADAPRLADATLGLVAACLAPSRDALERAKAPLQAAVIAEVRRYVDRHLNASDLTPDRVSQALGLPRSTLYAICEPMGGVAAFIQQRRLKRIHADPVRSEGPTPHRRHCGSTRLQQRGALQPRVPPRVRLQPERGARGGGGRLAGVLRFRSDLAERVDARARRLRPGV